MGRLIGGVLALWFALVAALGSAGLFANAPDALPLPLALGVLVPLMAYFAALRAWPAFRAWVLAADLRLVTAMQAWRFLGFGFIALWAHGVLPAVFAWPAGLGDMAVAAVAPWMLLALLLRADFARSTPFRVWQWFGLADLALALALGALASGFVPGLAHDVTTAAMAHVPLLFVPLYLVPIMVMLHATALLQARQRESR